MIDPLTLPGQHAAILGATMSQPEDTAYWHGAIAHVVANKIPGAIVECGVWRGGMLKAAQISLDALGAKREVWGYDNCAGMTETGPEDVGGVPVGALAVPEAELREYVGDGVRLVIGDVRETVAVERPKKIAVLRLDVDWYAATFACLEALWPRLSDGGVLLLDDYPYWTGCVRAVDRFLGTRAAELVRTGTGSGMVK